MEEKRPIVEKYSSGDIDVVKASGEIDVITIDSFREPVTSIAGSVENMVIDLRNVSYIDSAGLEVLIGAYFKQKQAGKKITLLVKQDSQPDEVIHVVCLHTLMQVTSNPEAAGLSE